MKGINLLIAIPAMDKCDTHFMFSMVRMIQKHPEYDVLPRIGSECHVSRDNLAYYAMQNNYDYICFIDSDEVFEPDDIEKLLKDGKEIVGGIICKREWPYEPILYRYNDKMPYNPWEMIQEIPKGIAKIDGMGGGGLLLIKVSTLRKMRNLTGELFFPINHWSEDLSFFYRAMQCNIEVFCDGKIRIGHRGMQTVTPDYWEDNYERDSKGTDTV